MSEPYRSATAAGLVALASPAFAQEPAAELVGVPDDAAFDAVRASVGRADRAAETVAQARRRARQSRTSVEAALRAEGYYGARVVAEARAGEPPVAVVRVEIGERFVIGRVSVELVGAQEGAGETHAAHRALELKAGAPARAEDVLKAEERLIKGFSEAGFPDVLAASREVVVDHAREVMDVTFHIETGRSATFGRVQNVGQARLRDGYLNRAAPFQLGEPYSRAKIERFENLLRDTGAFAGVDVHLADGEPGDGVEVREVVVEARTGARRTVAVGASYATSEGPGVEVEWSRRNVFGGAETLTTSAEASKLERRVDVEIAAPHFRKAQRTLRLGSSLENEETDAFDRTAMSARVEFEQPIRKRVAVAAGVEASGARLRDAGEEPDELVRVALPSSISWEGVDSQLDPQSGVRWTGRASPTVAQSSDTRQYAGVSSTARAYHSLADGALVAAARVKVGAVVGAGLDDVPADDRLYAGGGGSVRGYDFQAVGPVDEVGAPSGGRSLTETSAELRWRMRRSVGMVAFVDGGAVSEDLGPEFDQMLWGAGFGLRYYAAFGPLRADIATPVDPRDGDPTVQIYLGVGQSF